MENFTAFLAIFGFFSIIAVIGYSLWKSIEAGINAEFRLVEIESELKDLQSSIKALKEEYERKKPKRRSKNT